MGLFIGMDEAGYGPNLGPLVVTASVWQVPDDPKSFDFWSAFSEFVTSTRTRNDRRFHIGDSKEVHSSSAGIAPLERGVTALLRFAGMEATSFRQLWSTLHVDADCSPDVEPWYRDVDCPLPCEVELDSIQIQINQWGEAAEKLGVRLLRLRSDIVLTERFNSLTDRYDSKGLALSRIALNLLRDVWEPDGDEPTLIVGDKHGGRNRYDTLLQEILDGQMIFRLEEGTHMSRYRVECSEIQFRTQAESLFPVAVASMIAKYVREVAMELFNRFWQQQLPELQPTKGYPVDAARFRREIAEVQQQLKIPDTQLWRAK